MRLFSGEASLPLLVLAVTGVAGLFPILSLLDFSDILGGASSTSKTSAACHHSTNHSLVVSSDETNPRRPILFVHFHKSGGTSVCSTMYKQNRSFLAVPDGFNCNTPFSGPNLDERKWASIQSCRFLVPYTMDDDGIPFRRNTFLSLEVPFEEPMPCPGFRSYTIMRLPVKRVRSHIRSHHWTEKQVRKMVDNKTTPVHYYMDGYPIINSMVIRQLLGRERFRNVTPVNEDDLEQAKKIVENFDAFVPLEHLHHPRVLTLLKDTIPEYYAGLMRLNVTANVHGTPYEERPDDFVKMLQEENKYDMLLYQYMLDRLGIDES